MGHEFDGKYATKHPENITFDTRIEEELKKKGNSSISCAEAHKIAERLNINPSVVGVVIDLTERKIEKCQLNLFGHGKGKPVNKKNINPDSKIKSEIEKRIENDGKITCKSCWEIASLNNSSKIKITEILEGMEVKISKCQLGAF